MIKLVTFDALHTLITPRRPIYVQYSEIFAPFLGALSPSALQRSFKASRLAFQSFTFDLPLRGLKQVQKDKPVYHSQFGAYGWWSEVVKRTAIGAGADPQAVETSLNEIVPQLMGRFSSSEGYELFDDALPVLGQLQDMNVRTALISNSDARTRLVLADLGVSPYLNPLLLSEEEGVEKPDAEIFRRAFERSLGDVTHFDQAVHVGDELECDFYGAQAIGMQALLIRRPSPDGKQESKEADEDLGNAKVISSLHDVVDWVRSQIVA